MTRPNISRAPFRLQGVCFADGPTIATFHVTERDCAGFQAAFNWLCKRRMLLFPFRVARIVRRVFALTSAQCMLFLGMQSGKGQR